MLIWNHFQSKSILFFLLLTYLLTNLFTFYSSICKIGNFQWNFNIFFSIVTIHWLMWINCLFVCFFFKKRGWSFSFHFNLDSFWFTYLYSEENWLILSYETSWKSNFLLFIKIYNFYLYFPNRCKLKINKFHFYRWIVHSIYGIHFVCNLHDKRDNKLQCRLCKYYLYFIERKNHQVKFTM